MNLPTMRLNKCESECAVGGEELCRKHGCLANIPQPLPKEPLADALRAIRNRAIAKGMKLLDIEEIDALLGRTPSEKLSEHAMPARNWGDTVMLVPLEVAEEAVQKYYEKARQLNRGLAGLRLDYDSMKAALQEDIGRLQSATPQSDTAKVLAQVEGALRKNPLIAMFLDQGFWHAHHVDIVIRHDGQDRSFEADWIKDIWYIVRRRGLLEELKEINRAASAALDGRTKP